MVLGSGLPNGRPQAPKDLSGLFYPNFIVTASIKSRREGGKIKSFAATGFFIFIL